MAEEKGYISYDEATVNRLLKLVYDNQGAFPLDSAPEPESAKGITSGAVYEEIRKLREATVANKGYYATGEALEAAWPSAQAGDIAYVGTAAPYAVWKWNGSAWADSGEEHTPSFSLGDYYTKRDIDGMKANAAAEMERIGEGANYAVLDYVTSAAVTRLQVPEQSRKKGYEISYDPGTGMVKEVYVGDAVTNEEWQKDANWKTELPGEDIRALAESAAASEAAAKQSVQAAKEHMSAAQDAAQEAAQGADDAEAAATRAEGLVSDAEVSVDAANEAAGSANGAAAEARTQASEAQKQAQAAKEQATAAEAAARNADDAASEAEKQAAEARTQAQAAKEQAAAAEEQAGFAQQQGNYAKEMGDYISGQIAGATFLDISEIFTAVMSSPSEASVSLTVTENFYARLVQAAGAKACTGSVSQGDTVMNFPMSIHSEGGGAYEADIFVSQMYYSLMVGQKQAYTVLNAQVRADRQTTVTKSFVAVTGTGEGALFLADDGTYRSPVPVIDGRVFSEESGTISAEDWKDMKDILEAAASDTDGKLPAVQAMMYMVFATVPVIVTKDSGGYSIAYSTITDTNGRINVNSGAVSIEVSDDSVKYSMVSVGENIGLLNSQFTAIKARVDLMKDVWKLPYAVMELKDDSTSEDIAALFSGEEDMFRLLYGATLLSDGSQAYRNDLAGKTYIGNTECLLSGSVSYTSDGADVASVTMTFSYMSGGALRSTAITVQTDALVFSCKVTEAGFHDLPDAVLSLSEDSTSEEIYSLFGESDGMDALYAAVDAGRSVLVQKIPASVSCIASALIYVSFMNPFTGELKLVQLAKSGVCSVTVFSVKDNRVYTLPPDVVSLAGKPSADISGVFGGESGFRALGKAAGEGRPVVISGTLSGRQLGIPVSVRFDGTEENGDAGSYLSFIYDGAVETLVVIYDSGTDTFTASKV